MNREPINKQNLSDAVAEKLRAVFPEVEVLVSTENRDPYTYL